MVKDNRIWFGADGNNVPAVKKFLSEVKQGAVCQTIWKYDEVGHSQEGKKELNTLFPEASVFETPKPVRFLKRIFHLSTDRDSIILDFFAGSGTAAHATLQLNADDGGNRKFILVQLPEITADGSAAKKAGFKNVADICKERIRRAGVKILNGECHADWERDAGFRVLRVDTSNVKDVYYTPDQTNQKSLLAAIDNIKSDRTSEDLLFQVLVDWGVDLTLPIDIETIKGKKVLFVDQNALAACFETGVTEDVIMEMASREPLRVVFRDSGLVSDAMKINVEQIFKQLSPMTDVKAI